jgi:tetratricopeptide (TPR) repeat protein
MRNLLIPILALAASLSLSPVVHAADTPSPPQPSPKPKDPDLEAGRQAVEAQNWKVAIEDFDRAAVRDPKNADAQNLLGYSWRKSGNLDALRIDPGHKGAHEYIGEAYLMVNNLPKAEEHLTRLDKLCFLPCSEYSELKKAVEKYKSSR